MPLTKSLAAARLAKADSSPSTSAPDDDVARAGAEPVPSETTPRRARPAMHLRASAAACQNVMVWAAF